MVKHPWSEETHVIYEAATTARGAEGDARVMLGAKLAHMRVQRRLSQLALSLASGAQQAEISRIENGRGNPTLATLERLATVLGARLDLVDVDEPDTARCLVDAGDGGVVTDLV